MPLQLLGALLGSILVTTISVVQSYDIINRKRDQIFSGHIDGHSISLFHRKVIYLNDWLPLVTYIELFMVIFSIIIIVTPFILIKDVKKQ